MEQVQPHKYMAYLCYAPHGACKAVADRLTRYLQDFRVPQQLRRLYPRTPSSLGLVQEIATPSETEPLHDAGYLVVVCPADGMQGAEAAVVSFLGLLKPGETVISADKIVKRLQAVPADRKARVLPVVIRNVGHNELLSPVLNALGSSVITVEQETEETAFLRLVSSLLRVPADVPWEAWKSHRKPHMGKRIALLSMAALGVACVALFGAAYFAPDGEAESDVGHARLTQDADSQEAQLRRQQSLHHIYERDAAGRVTAVSTLDEAGMPCPDQKGVCRTTYTYDAQGHVTSRRFFDEEGKPCCSLDGYAASCSVYDARGIVVSQSFFDEKGAPTLNREDYASVVLHYDERGNLVSQSYFDEEGAPCEWKGGYASLLLDYDGDGNMVMQRFFNEKGEPVRCAAGFAIVRSTYDDKGLLLSERFFNAVDEPCVNQEGVHCIEYRYDAHGHRVSSESFPLE